MVLVHDATKQVLNRKTYLCYAKSDTARLGEIGFDNGKTQCLTQESWNMSLFSKKWSVPLSIWFQNCNLFLISNPGDGRPVY